MTDQVTTLPHYRGFTTETFTIVTVCEGDGTAENPWHTVEYWHDYTGTLFLIDDSDGGLRRVDRRRRDD